MPNNERPSVVVTRYYKRRGRVRDLLPALGVGLATGVAAWYLARVFFLRTELSEKRISPSDKPASRSATRPSARPAGTRSRSPRAG